VRQGWRPRAPPTPCLPAHGARAGAARGQAQRRPRGTSASQVTHSVFRMPSLSIALGSGRAGWRCVCSVCARQVATLYRSLLAPEWRRASSFLLPPSSPRPRVLGSRSPRLQRNASHLSNRERRPYPCILHSIPSLVSVPSCSHGTRLFHLLSSVTDGSCPCVAGSTTILAVLPRLHDQVPVKRVGRQRQPTPCSPQCHRPQKAHIWCGGIAGATRRRVAPALRRYVFFRAGGGTAITCTCG